VEWGGGEECGADGEWIKELRWGMGAEINGKFTHTVKDIES